MGLFDNLEKYMAEERATSARSREVAQRGAEAMVEKYVAPIRKEGFEAALFPKQLERAKEKVSAEFKLKEELMEWNPKDPMTWKLLQDSTKWTGAPKHWAKVGKELQEAYLSGDPDRIRKVSEKRRLLPMKSDLLKAYKMYHAEEAARKTAEYREMKLATIKKKKYPTRAKGAAVYLDKSNKRFADQAKRTLKDLPPRYIGGKTIKPSGTHLAALSVPITQLHNKHKHLSETIKIAFLNKISDKTVVNLYQKSKNFFLYKVRDEMKRIKTKYEKDPDMQEKVLRKLRAKWLKKKGNLGLEEAKKQSGYLAWGEIYKKKPFPLNFGGRGGNSYNLIADAAGTMASFHMAGTNLPGKKEATIKDWNKFITKYAKEIKLTPEKPAAKEWTKKEKVRRSAIVAGIIPLGVPALATAPIFLPVVTGPAILGAGIYFGSKLLRAIRDKMTPGRKKRRLLTKLAASKWGKLYMTTDEEGNLKQTKYSEIKKIIKKRIELGKIKKKNRKKELEKYVLGQLYIAEFSNDIREINIWENKAKKLGIIKGL